MGVMSCSRRGCESIMCDHYSSDYGYICHDCLEELSQKGVGTNIEEFMDSKKKGDNQDEIDRAYKYFLSIFS